MAAEISKIYIVSPLMTFKVKIFTVSKQSKEK